MQYYRCPAKSGIGSRLNMNPTILYLSHLASQMMPIEVQAHTLKKTCRSISALTVIDRRFLAEEASTSPQTLLKLSRDKDPEVRLSAGEHPNMPYVGLRELVQDPCIDVRFGLAGNHNIPISILSMLTQDENPYVEDRAKRSLDRLQNGKLAVSACVKQI